MPAGQAERRARRQRQRDLGGGHHRPRPPAQRRRRESGGDERSLTDHPDGDVVVADAVEQRVRDHSREGAAATIVGQSGSRIRG
jgi:hypothetical protein